MTRERLEELDKLAKDAEDRRDHLFFGDLKKSRKTPEYLSHVDPQTILEMIAYIRELEDKIKELVPMNHKYNDLIDEFKSIHSELGKSELK